MIKPRPRTRVRRAYVCETTFRRLHAQGLTWAEIARHLKIGSSTASQRGRLWCLTPNCDPNKLEPIKRADVLPLWLEGHTPSEIARRLGVDPKRLHGATRRFNLPARAMVSRGKYRVIAQEQEAEPEAQPAPTDLTGRLLATKGRWAELAKVADKHGLTMAQVQQRYHKARTG
jgi:DNA-binding CsgD family transcriptional regulator